MLAILNLGPGEILLLLVLGVVLFGRDLPGVGRRLGQTVANLRRSLNEFKRQLDADDSIREIRESMNETRKDLNKITKVPRVVANPSSVLQDFAKEAMQPLPEDAEPAPEEERKVPDGAVPVEEGMMSPVMAAGVSMMSIGYHVPPDQPVICRGPMLHQSLTQLLSRTNWGPLDYMIIDMPPGTGDVAITLSQSLPATGASQD